MKVGIAVKSRKNFQLLSQYLEDIGFNTTEISEDCDVIIVDALSFDENRIAELKRKAEPTFLPVILLTARSDVGLATRQLWRCIDDVIKMPVDKLELAAKVVTLARAREYSIKLNEALEAIKIINSVIRHDIINDLAVILGYMEAGCDEYQSRIADRLQHIAKRLEDMRDYEKFVDFQELRCVSLREAVEDSFSIKPDLQAEVNDLCVIADGFLSAVIYNIVSNAVKHCGEDVSVRIKAQEHGAWVEITIADDGKGIPDEIKEKIFEEGFKHESSGSGLGLFFAKRLIERYGGKIEVKDNKPRGTIFRILLRKCY